MPNATVNEINLYYEQHGRGPDLILIAGYSATIDVWKFILPHLTSHYKVTVFDNRGAGQSDSPSDPYSIEAMADDVIGLMDHLDIKHATVLGHSMGGFILQALLTKYPSRVDRGIILATRLTHASSYLINRDIDAEMIAAGLPLSLVAKHMATYLFGDEYLASKENLDAYINDVIKNAPMKSMIGLQRQAQASAEFDKQALLDQITVPMLAIYGQEDVIARVSTVSILAQKVRDIRIEILASCGHIPQYEKPEKLAALILGD